MSEPFDNKEDFGISNYQFDPRMLSMIAGLFTGIAPSLAGTSPGKDPARTSANEGRRPGVTGLSLGTCRFQPIICCHWRCLTMTEAKG